MPRCPKCMNYVVDEKALLCRIASCGYKRKLKHRRSTFLVTLCASALLHVLLVIGLTPTSWWQYWHEQIHENTAVTIAVTVIVAVLWYFITLALAGLGWITVARPILEWKGDYDSWLADSNDVYVHSADCKWCPACGESNAGEAHFCRVCGIQLASRTEVVTTPADQSSARAVLPS